MTTEVKRDVKYTQDNPVTFEISVAVDNVNVKNRVERSLAELEYEAFAKGFPDLHRKFRDDIADLEERLKEAQSEIRKLTQAHENRKP